MGNPFCGFPIFLVIEWIDQKMSDLFFYNGFIFFYESFILNGLSIGICKYTFPVGQINAKVR